MPKHELVTVHIHSRGAEFIQNVKGQARKLTFISMEFRNGLFL